MATPNTAGNPLSASSLSLSMAKSIPIDVSPQLKTPYDAVALAVHAGMVAVGFRLIGLGEEDRIASRSETNEPQPLPPGWNASPSNCTFRYAHSQSSMEFLIKVNRLSKKAIVFGVALGDDRTAQFEVRAEDYVSASSLPATPKGPDASTEDVSRIVQEIFISPNRLSDLGALLKVSIIQQVAPSIHGKGYEEERRGEPTRSGPLQGQPRLPERDPLRRPEPQPTHPYPSYDPLAGLPQPAPRNSWPDGRPPGFDDDHEINTPRHRTPGWIPGHAPLGNIGGGDLNPPGLGPRDPLRPAFGPGGLPQPGGGGMHPTFDDPIFGGQTGPGNYDPQAPLGARYDPLGPQDRRADMRGGHGGWGGFPGHPPNPFGGFGDGDFI